MRRTHRWKAGLGALVLLGVILGGPHGIHLFYHLTTPESVIASRRLDYETLADEESSLSPVAQNASIRKRHALLLWFHVRGLSIDEDAEAQAIANPWKELLDYWKQASP